MRRNAALLLNLIAGLAAGLTPVAHGQTVAWAQTYNGPSEPPAGTALGSTDDARALAVDPDGSIFAGGVTQSFENVTGAPQLKFVPHDDFVVLKYNANGDRLWSASFDFPTAGDDQSSAAMRSGVDSMAAMVLVPDGGVVAAGRATTRYSENGLFGFTQAGVVKFTAQGEVAWYQLLGDPAVSSVATTLISDGAFGLYVGGATGLASPNQDSFITALDGAGVPIWSVSANYPFSQILQLVRDPASACVALAGISGGGCKLVRVSGSGVATTIDIPALASSGTGVGLALAADGGVVVAGVLAGDLILAKIDAGGTQTWTTAWRLPDSRSVVARAVGVSPDGTVRVAGHTGSLAGVGGDYFVADFDGVTGAALTHRTLDSGLGLGEVSARAGVTIEPSGRALVAGFTPAGSPGDNDYAVAVFGAGAGGTDWTARWSNPANPGADDRAAAIAGLPTGDVVVLGRSDNGAASADLATLVIRPADRSCDSIDFNNNTVFPEDQDVIDFFTVLAGGECAGCNDIDFNNNAVFPEDQDVIDFFTVLAGGAC